MNQRRSFPLLSLVTSSGARERHAVSPRLVQPYELWESIDEVIQPDDEVIQPDEEVAKQGRQRSRQPSQLRPSVRRHSGIGHSRIHHLHLRGDEPCPRARGLHDHCLPVPPAARDAHSGSTIQGGEAWELEEEEEAAVE